MIRAALLLLAFALVSCRQHAPLPNYTGSQKVGQPLQLVLPVHKTGGMMDLSQEKGRVVLLDVWATWCEPCVTQLGVYQDFQKEYGDRGLQVYAITVDEDLNQVDKFLGEHNLTLPVLVDQRSTVSETILGVQQLPTSFLIDRHGVVRYVHEGFDESELSVYAKEIEALLAEAP